MDEKGDRVMPDVLPRVWGEMRWAADALTGFPVYVVWVLLLGLWVFWRGRSLLVEPAHEIDLGEAADRGKGSQPVGDREGRARDRRVRLFRRSRRAEGQASPLGAPDAEDERAGGGYPRFPCHDAPVWLFGWLLVFAGAAVLCAADAAWSIATGVTLPLERTVLGVLLPPALVPLPRPAVALAVYTASAYLGLELARAFVGRLMGLGHLHLLHPNDVRRRVARSLFSLCGFQDFRRLEYGTARWWLGAGLGACGGLAAADLAAFYTGASGGLGILAVAHLFPVVVARVFDQVWLYPVRFRHAGPTTRVATPVEQLVALLTRRGRIVAVHQGQTTDPISWHLHAREEARTFPFHGEEGTVLAEFLRALTGTESWYGHQKEAWDAVVGGKSALLLGPGGSGKTVTGMMLAMHRAVANGETAVLIYPDPSSCQREYARFCDTLFRTGIRWNLGVLDGTRPDAASLDWAQESPSVVFCDVDSLEGLLFSGAQGVEAFLSALGLMVLEDADRLTGSPASDLYFLVRRLDGMRRRFSSRELRWVATARPVAEELQTQLSLVLGEHLILVQGDRSPTTDVMGYLVVPPADTATHATGPFAKRPGLDAFVEDLQATGHDPVLVTPSVARPWRDPGAGGAEDALRLPGAAVSVARLDDSGALRTVFALRNAGARTVAPFHASFWVARPEPFVTLLVDLLEELREKGRTAWEERRRFPLGGGFCFSADNPHIAKRHLVAALAEGSLSRGELFRLWGRSVVEKAVADLGGDGSDPAPEHGRAPWNVDGGARIGSRGDPVRTRVVCHDAVHVDDAVHPKARLLLQVDRDIAPTALYPGRVILCGGRRYRVPMDAPDGAHAASVLVKPEEQSIFTTKVRRCSVQWLRERSRIRSQAGAAPFVLRRGEVLFEEQVMGFREWDEDSNQLVATHIYEHLSRPIPKAGVQTVAAEVSFPGESLTSAALQVLGSLFRAVVRARFGNDPSPPEVVEWSETPVQNPGSAAPVLCLVETYPGGVGYVDRITPLLVMEWLRLMHLLVKRVGLKAPEVLINPAACQSVRCGAPPSADLVLRFLRENPLILTSSASDTAPGTEEGSPEPVEEVKGLLDRVLPGEEAESGAELPEPQEEREGAAPLDGPPINELAQAYRKMLQETSVLVSREEV